MEPFFSGQLATTVDLWKQTGEIPAGTVVHRRLGVATSHALEECLMRDLAAGDHDAVPVVLGLDLDAEDLEGAKFALLGCVELAHPLGADRLRFDVADDGRALGQLARLRDAGPDPIAERRLTRQAQRPKLQPLSVVLFDLVGDFSAALRDATSTGQAFPAKMPQREGAHDRETAAKAKHAPGRRVAAAQTKFDASPIGLKLAASREHNAELDRLLGR